MEPSLAKNGSLTGSGLMAEASASIESWAGEADAPAESCERGVTVPLVTIEVTDALRTGTGAGWSRCERLDEKCGGRTPPEKDDWFERGTSRLWKTASSSVSSVGGSLRVLGLTGLVRPNDVEKPAPGAGRGAFADSSSSRSRSEPGLGKEEPPALWTDRYEDERKVCVFCESPSVPRDETDPPAVVSFVEAEYMLVAASSR